MKSGYTAWLEHQGYADNTRVAQIHRVKKVEGAYGDLDTLIAEGRFDDVIRELSYSTDDERHGRPNPSRLTFNGNIRNNLQSYKNAALRYRTFLERDFDQTELQERTNPEVFEDAPAPTKLALEKDLQAALRRNIESLEPGLNIIDDGTERGVDSGFIDILCEDANSQTVVIELKAGKTDARVIGQILGYMGNILEEEKTPGVRGIIVAHEFDKRTRAACRAIPNLTLRRYAISFEFEDVD